MCPVGFDLGRVFSATAPVFRHIRNFLKLNIIIIVLLGGRRLPCRLPSTISVPSRWIKRDLGTLASTK